MKKLIIILLFIPLLGLAQNPTIGETWHEGQGQSHFIYSAGIELGTVTLLHGAFEMKKEYAYPLSMLTTFTVGYLWELDGNKNIYDLGWDFVGICVGLGIYMIIDWIAERHEKKQNIKYY